MLGILGYVLGGLFEQTFCNLLQSPIEDVLNIEARSRQ